MLNKRIEHVCTRMNFRICEKMSLPLMNLKFTQEPGPIASTLVAATKTLTINTQAIAETYEKSGANPSNRDLESVCAWLIAREHYFLGRGKDHQTDLSKITSANAAALLRGYEDAKRVAEGR